MSRYTNTVPAIHDKNGLPIVGAKKFFFKPGTTIPKTVYKDPDFIIPQTNPVLSDSVGRFPDIFLDGVYKELQQDNSGTQTGFDGVTLWTKDPVGDAPISGEFQPWNPLVTYVITSIVVGSDDNYYKSKTDPNLNNDPVSNPLSWTQLKFGEVWNPTTSYFISASVYALDGFLYFAIADNVNKEPSISSEWKRETGIPFAIATGTGNAIAAAFIPTIITLDDGLEVRVRAIASNSSETPTFSANGLPAKTITKYGSVILSSGDINGSGHDLILVYDLANDVWELLNPAIPDGIIIGAFIATNSTIISTTSQIPFDNSIPQITEGGLILTRSYTPKYSGSMLLFDVSCNVSGSTGAGTDFTVALFDGATDAISCNSVTSDGAGGIYPVTISDSGFYPKDVQVTFTVRVGKGSSGSTYINSDNGTAKLGGTLSCSIKITEVK